MRARNTFGRRGFTLLELMLVVTVLAIICAMAIPSLLHARMAANEASAISTCRAVATVMEQYRVRFAAYPSALADLWAAGYMDSSVASKSGYNFSYTVGGGDWTLNGDPMVAGSTGTRHFFVDSSGVIRFNTTGAATSADSALGD